jgi:glycopeptide antibiotics resistance protein
MNFINNIQWKRTIVISLFLLVVGSVFYYSWLPYSNLRTESYLPKWILKWSNEYVNLRTAVPFVALGYLLEVWTRLSKKNNFKKNAPFQSRTVLIAVLIVCLAEGGQFLITDRHPDVMDIFFGILGSCCGIFCHYLIQKINLLFFNRNA